MTTIAMMTAVALNAPMRAVSAHVAVSSTVPVCMDTMTIAATGAAIVSGLGSELAYGTVQAKLDHWTRLPHDWDGDNGVPLDSSVATNAINILSLLQSNRIPCPTPYIAGDGEAGLRWQTLRGFASISFLRDKHVVAFVRPQDGKSFSFDEQFNELLPISDLIEQIRSVA